ncbi:hypothetical protein ACJZ2D_016346 [Fusarium nematophilum]
MRFQNTILTGVYLNKDQEKGFTSQKGAKAQNQLFTLKRPAPLFPTVFRYYFKNELETAKAPDEDGWFHTGSVFLADEPERFKIIDRVKNGLQVSQGELVAPERIENIYLSSSPLLGAAFIHRDPHQSSLVILLVVAPDLFADFKMMNDKKVRGAAEEWLEGVALKSRLSSFETVRAFKLIIDPFTAENNLLTPIFKLKRRKIVQTYRELLDELYNERDKKNSTGGLQLHL